MDVDREGQDTGRTARSTVLATLGFSLLNPHVYIDTVVLLGGIGASHPPDERLAFALGAMTASLLWFYGLSYGATLLAPLYRRRSTWRLLDGAVGCATLAIAAGLVLPHLG